MVIGQGRSTKRGTRLEYLGWPDDARKWKRAISKGVNNVYMEEEDARLISC